MGKQIAFPGHGHQPDRAVEGGQRHRRMDDALGVGGQHGKVNGFPISTAAGAARAGAFIALAVDHLSRQRAIVGAEASRLSHTLEALRSYEENIRSAESQMRDVDMALESTNFAKYQILTQVGTAMLAQANALPQNVLQLLG